MKTREGSVPDLVRATRLEHADPEPDAESRSGPVRNTLKTAEIDVSRDRRTTLTSPIPAMIAEAMSGGHAVESTPGPRPAVPETTPPARVAPAALEDTGVTRWRARAADWISSTRAALDAGDITAAVSAAEEVLREADQAPPAEIDEVIEPARPLLTRALATYVGPSNGVPVLAPRADEIARVRLGAGERALMARIDGVRSFDELFDGTGFGTTEALRIAARLLKSGAIRII